jgi:hypothetical protein
MNKLLVGAIALVTVFFYARFGGFYRTRSPPAAGSRHSRRVKEYGSEPRAKSVYRRAQPEPGRC